jgi:streptogramin lyase
MSPKRTCLPLALAFTLLAACIWLVALASADMAATEMDLNPAGAAYEINPDAGGSLWISDYGAGQIWQVEASGAYTVYPVAPVSAPSDARRHGSGDVWFADGETNGLGRLSPASLELTIWAIPDTEGLYGTAIDPTGRIWVTDATNPRLYRFEPSSGQICTYTLPNGGFSDYVLAHQQEIWLGDWQNGRILRLDPGLSLYTTWDLDPDASPAGLARDGQGHLWWADPNLAELGRLEPASDRLTRYNLPRGYLPQMIAANEGLIYYTEFGLGTFGVLDPTVAASTTVDLAPGTVETTASCTVIQSASTSSIMPSAGTASWSAVTYSTLYAAGGWSIYQLPDGSFPWGIAANGPGMWFVDSGRQVLARLASGAQLAACVVDDADGDPATTGDQVPLPGRTLTVLQDGAPFDQQVSGTDGCYTWPDLPGNRTYQVATDTPTGWIALTPSLHDFGRLLGGEARSHTFINFEAVTATACKYEDLAGDGLTADDPLYDQGWQVSLTADGQVVDTQTTGPGGCYTWDGLGPLEEGAYGVREAEVAGWEATEPAEVQFAPPTSGDTFQADLANFQQASLTACVLADEDGDLGTPGGQEPQAGWTVYLRVDGQNQLPGQQTGTEGCATWTGLGPGHTYGAAQALPEGWAALAGTEQDLDPVRSGDAETITFVNTTQEDYTVFLPLVVRNWH